MRTQRGRASSSRVPSRRCSTDFVRWWSPLPAEAGPSANDQQLVTELCTWANRCLAEEGLDPYPVDECVRDESAAFDPRARADMQDCLDIAKGSCLDFFDTPMCTGG
ncbi:hypothetical protein PPSIR1_02141 [Plesiocystis pacifica SIR-1]|uniref:Uncharacterized protein n=1 Tax=Plesiocystis pacifica SIR-1 TaxID=391625 RepID=A6G3Z2_9BACT|nr:hypothetical protein [Plesiocystis pacifica]EDM79315.1 hypothetical protein PPSIR1_02141 [Plesiocystis pacifica SIR-1]